MISPYNKNVVYLVIDPPPAYIKDNINRYK